MFKDLAQTATQDDQVILLATQSRCSDEWVDLRRPRHIPVHGMSLSSLSPPVPDDRTNIDRFSRSFVVRMEQSSVNCQWIRSASVLRCSVTCLATQVPLGTAILTIFTVWFGARQSCGWILQDAAQAENLPGSADASA